MADVVERIYELDEQAVNDNAYYTIVDSEDWTDSKKITVENFLEPETTAREAADDAIQVGTGLDATTFNYSTDETTNYLKNADFLAAGETPSLKNADKLLDAKLYEVEGKLYLEVITVLTKAQLELINTTEVVHIAAPGAGYVINLKDVTGKNNFNTTAWVGNSLQLQCNGQVLGYLSQPFVESNAIMYEKGNVAQNVELTANTAVVLTAALDFINGDGTISVRTQYELIDAAFGAGGGEAAPTCCNFPKYGIFQNADLNGANQLVLYHGRNTQLVMGVQIVDPNGESELKTFKCGDGNNAYADPANYVTIEFPGAIAAGNWTYYYILVV